MTISPELLSKAAKVYEAAEAVEGMKPKMQEEEHKKMTPDEFSRENSKSAAWPSFIENANTWLQDATSSKNSPAQVNYHNLALMGAGIGGIGGALSAPKGKMLKRMLQGAGIGGVAGLGAGLGGQIGINMASHRKFPDEAVSRNGARAFLPLIGAAGGGVLAHTLADKALNEVTDDTASNDNAKRKKEDEDLAEMRTGLAKISSTSTAAHAFGVKAARALLPVLDKALQANSRR